MDEKFSNELTDAQLEALAILAEECGEVVQRVGKVLRHGLMSRRPSTGELNVKLLQDEIGDICAALDVLTDLGVISEDPVYDRHEWKLRKFRDEPERLHHIQVLGDECTAVAKADGN